MPTTVADDMRCAQVDDDPALLDRMLADARAGAPIYQPTNYWSAYEESVVRALREGLLDFRRRTGSILSTFGATDEPPRMLGSLGGVPPEYESFAAAVVKTLNTGLEKNDPVLPYALRTSDVFELAYAYCREQSRRAATIVSIDDLAISRVGNPFGFERDGRFLTNAALYYYMRYAFVAEHVDLRDVDVVVELGSGCGKQVEILKRLHPHLTFVLVDLAPQLYVAERFLRTVFPDDTVAYDDTRGEGSPELQPGKIHFVGNARIEDVQPRGKVLFWNAASFGEMEPDVVANYAKVVSPIADWLYLCQCFTGKEPAQAGRVGGVLDPVVWSHYVAAFAEHESVARTPAHTGYAPLVQGSCAYDDTFWIRTT